MIERETDHGRDRTADSDQHTRHLQLLVRAPESRGNRRQAPERKPQRQQPRPSEPVDHVANERACNRQRKQHHRRQPPRLALGKIELGTHLRQDRCKQPVISRIEQVHRTDEQQNTPGPPRRSGSHRRRTPRVRWLARPASVPEAVWVRFASLAISIHDDAAPRRPLHTLEMDDESDVWTTKAMLRSRHTARPVTSAQQVEQPLHRRGRLTREESWSFSSARRARRSRNRYLSASLDGTRFLCSTRYCWANSVTSSPWFAAMS